MDARENQKALIELAQANNAAAAVVAGTPGFTASNNAASSESDDSVGAASVGLTNNCDIAQQDKEIRDLTKDFSVCAPSFGHPEGEAATANAL